MDINRCMVTITDSAKEYMRHISHGQYVTLGVKGGGCSGFQYVWGLSEKAADERILWSKPIDDILLLDPLAEMHIIGSKIDFVEELGGSFLKIINPNTVSSCGCGESFNVA